MDDRGVGRNAASNTRTLVWSGTRSERPHSRTICSVSISSQSVTFEIVSAALRLMMAGMRRYCSHVLETIILSHVQTFEEA